MRKGLFRFVGCVAAVMACAYYLPGVRASDWTQALTAGALLGLVYWIFRPVARLLLAIFNLMTLGLLGIALDAGLVLLAANLIEGFEVDGFAWALALSLAVNLGRYVLGSFAKKR